MVERPRAAAAALGALGAPARVRGAEIVSPSFARVEDAGSSSAGAPGAEACARADGAAAKAARVGSMACVSGGVIEAIAPKGAEEAAVVRAAPRGAGVNGEPFTGVVSLASRAAGRTSGEAEDIGALGDVSPLRLEGALGAGGATIPVAGFGAEDRMATVETCSRRGARLAPASASISGACAASAPVTAGAAPERRARSVGPAPARGESADRSDGARSGRGPGSGPLGGALARDAIDFSLAGRVIAASDPSPSSERARCVGVLAGDGLAPGSAVASWLVESAGEAVPAPRTEIGACADGSGALSDLAEVERWRGAATLSVALGEGEASATAAAGLGATPDEGAKPRDAATGAGGAGETDDFGAAGGRGASPSSAASPLADASSGRGGASAGAATGDETNCVAQLCSRKAVGARLAGAGSADASEFSSPSRGPLADSADAAAPCPSAPRAAAASNCDKTDANSLAFAPASSTKARDG
jgi:hypothetical protein